jgi:hypothetical protein
MKIITFGDSWAAGWGLKKKEKNFTSFLADYLKCKKLNFGMSSSSLGHILHDFTQNIHNAKQNDFIIIIIPPDIRWYTQSGKDSFRSMLLGDKDHKNFISDKSDYWFIYHHSVFVHSLYSVCAQLNLNYILAHNYGHLQFVKPFDQLIPDSIFLDRHKSLTTLLGGEDYADYDFKNDGPPDTVKGNNFIPNDVHPNETGHKLIAEMILGKINEKL